MESLNKLAIQEEITGGGIASVATIVGKTYSKMKAIANSLDIYADDKSLWSYTGYVRRLLAHEGKKASSNEAPFSSWDNLPNLALLSIKHHQEQGINFWHWVVFYRSKQQAVVFDSNSKLATNVRTDFDEMQPAWFIEIQVF